MATGDSQHSFFDTYNDDEDATDEQRSIAGGVHRSVWEKGSRRGGHIGSFSDHKIDGQELITGVAASMGTLLPSHENLRRSIHNSFRTVMDCLNQHS